MEPVRLGVGTEWLLDGRAFRVVQQLAADRFVARDLKFNLDQTLAEAEILALYAQGRLRFATGALSPDSSSLTEPTSAIVHDLSPRERDILERRWQAIGPLTTLMGDPTSADFRARARELQQLGTPCSPRSLRRHFRVWQRAGKNRMALVPAHSRRGRRGRSRRNSFLERYPILRRLVDDAIQSLYLTMARRPISAVTRRVFDDLQRHNARLPAAQAIPVPREATLDRAISRRIAQLDPWEVDRARWGKRIADRRHQSTTRQQLAGRILERVEIDHSPLKVVVGTEAGPIGQPWLTVLIDYYSRMIVGFCLGFEPPSYGVLMEALRHAILPKAYLAEAYPRVQGAWPCYGIPEKVVCDRGSDLTSNDLEQAAFQLGIALDFTPPRTPHFKGTVESFFDVLNDQLLASLPGRTFRSWERRADYNPDDGPLMPYEALLEIIHIHLVDVYAAGKHPTAAKTRLEMWQESAAEFPPCLPGSPDELLVLLSKRVARKLSARGIELGGMFYTSDELLALRAELAAQNLSIDRLQVRYNPWDLGTVWVLNPLNKGYLRAPAVDTAMQGMTEYQWRVLKRAIRERFDDPDHLLSLAAGRNAIRDVIEATVNQPSRRRRLRAARFLQQPGQRYDVASPTDAEWIDVGDHSSSPAPPLTPVTQPAPPTDLTGLPASQPADDADPSTDIVDPDELDVDDWDVA